MPNHPFNITVGAFATDDGLRVDVYEYQDGDRVEVVFSTVGGDVSLRGRRHALHRVIAEADARLTRIAEEATNG